MEVLAASILGIFLFLGVYEYLYRFMIDRKITLKKFNNHTNFISFINFIFIKIPYVCYCGLISLFTILTLPITWIRILAVHFSFSKWNEVYFPEIIKNIKKVYEIAIKKLKDLYSKAKNNINKENIVKEQLEIFKECLQLYVNGADTQKNSGLFKFFLGAAIVILQFGISFPTTLAGSKLFFSSISPMAPYFFTVVVQGLIVGFSMNAFSKNKRGKLLKIGLWGTVTVSVIFSYTGIVIAQDSPESTYRSAYEVYETSFEATKKEILGNLFDDTKAKDSLMQIIESLKSNKDIMNTLKKIKENQRDGITVPNQFYQNYIDENGNTISSVIGGAFEAAAKIEAEISNINAEIYKLESAIDKLNELPNETVVSELIDKFLKEHEDENATSEITDALTTEKLKSWIKLSNDINSSIANNTLEKLSEDTIDDITSKFEKFNTFDEINIKKSSEIFGDGVTDSVANADDQGNKADNESENKSTDTTFDFLNIFKFWDVALSDDMSSLTKYRKEIRNETEKSYNKIEKNGGFASIDESSKNLFENSKNAVMDVPSVFSYALATISQVHHNPIDYISMFFMALLIDVGSAILGYLKQGRTESFLYVRSSKDYYNEYDDLFEILFMSLMNNYHVRLQKGTQSKLDIHHFQEECLEQMKNTSNQINKFLEMFDISMGTWNLGFNLICEYDKDNFNEYKPLISILLKTKLIKIISEKQYRILLKNTYLDNFDDYRESDGSKKKMNDKDKYYIVLRNKGENYLRESIPVHYQTEHNDEVETNE